MTGRPDLLGHTALKIDFGPQTIKELGADLAAVLDWREICAVEMRADMEGFALRVYDGHI